MNKKKRICLIGMEHGHGSTAEVLSAERIEAVELWAKRSGFDEVAILCSDQGLCSSTEAARPPARLLKEMSKKEREAWAGSVVAEVNSRWVGKDHEGIREVVLLCGISGYQELAQKLDGLGGGIMVTMPLPGTQIVPRSKGATAEEKGCETVLAAAAV